MQKMSSQAVRFRQGIGAATGHDILDTGIYINSMSYGKVEWLMRFMNPHCGSDHLITIVQQAIATRGLG